MNKKIIEKCFVVYSNPAISYRDIERLALKDFYPDLAFLQFCPGNEFDCIQFQEMSFSLYRIENLFSLLRFWKRQGNKKKLFLSMGDKDLLTIIFFLFAKLRGDVIAVAPSLDTSPQMVQSRKLNFSRVLKNISSTGFFSYFKAILVGKIAGVFDRTFKYDYLLAAGEKGVNSRFIVNEVLFSCSKDFSLFYKTSLRSDEYLRELGLKSCGYILFLDEYEPFHPDYVRLKIKTVDPLFYYSSLNSFFDRVEKEFGLPVVIAAHPRGNEYYQKNNPFDGRRLIFSETAYLTRFSHLVLSESSTSTNFAVLNHKPIIFFLNQEQFSLYKYEYMLGYINYFKTKLLNINSETDQLSSFVCYDQKLYSEYIKDFIRSDKSQETETFKILFKKNI